MLGVSCATKKLSNKSIDKLKLNIRAISLYQWILLLPRPVLPIKMAVAGELETLEALAAVNDYCHRASGCFPSVSRLTTTIFLLKVAIRWAAFNIGSIKAVAAPWFKDPGKVKVLQGIINYTFQWSFCLLIIKSIK